VSEILFVKILTSSLDGESRDKREISLFLDLGFNVEVFCKGKTNEIEVINKKLLVNKFNITNSEDKKILKIFKRIYIIIKWSILIKKLKPKIISGHDMIGTYISWLSSIFTSKKTRPKIIYDSHEFELYRDVSGRKKIMMPIIYLFERFIINKSDIVMMVNESIAEEVQRIYKLKEKPLIIRNTPEKWILDEVKRLITRQQLSREIGTNEEVFIVMYHGMVSPSRGIDKLLEAISQLDEVVAVVLGFGNAEYISLLKKQAKSLGIASRVIFKDAVSIEELPNYVGAANIGVSLAPNTHKNHYYMLPNKLFENIQALTPIIASDFPEIKKIISGYDVGLLVNPGDANAIASAILQIKNNKKLNQKFKLNLMKAKEDLHWDFEKKKLEDKIRGMV